MDCRIYKAASQKRRWAPVVVAYQMETHIRRYEGRAFVVENRTPVYRREERDGIKRDIERRLYEVFRKYASAQ